VSQDAVSVRSPGMTTLQTLTDQKTVLLTTYKRDGTAVGTPVNVAVEGDRGYFRTWETAWKARRLRNNPEIELAPSSQSGKPTGPPMRARARLLDGDEARHAARLINRKHPVLQRIMVHAFHKLTRKRTLHYEVTPT
jgi:PPOX class probable F420-dependent enzyme